MLIFSFLVEILPLHQRGFVENYNAYQHLNTTSERHGPKFFEPKFFGPKFFGPKFFGPKFFWTQIFWPKFFLPKIFGPKFFDPNFFDPNFWTQIVSTQNFLTRLFWTRNFLDPKFLDPNFLEPRLKSSETQICSSCLFQNILKVVFFLMQGGPPLHPPPLRGGPAYRPGDYAKSEPIKM